MSEAIFQADPEGWRAQNADRPAAHLIRELVQNALDEDGVTVLDVEVTYHGPRKGTTVKVTDNSPAGVADPKLLFTIWLSTKEDSPTKRGRMGRGLKELVSVADMTVIRSAPIDALVFKRHKGGRWERKSKPRLGRPEAGTEVTVFCRAWGKDASRSIVEFLRLVRPPSQIKMRVGYRDDSITAEGAGPIMEPIVPFQASENFTLTLPTVIFEAVDGERAERERQRECRVECFVPPPGEKAYVYEMGIPVEETEMPVSIDVGQRVILRERRDTLTESYKRKLFAKVLSKRMDGGFVEDDQLRDNATLIAATSIEELSYSAKERIARVWSEGRPFATDAATRSLATGHHIEVVNLRGLPEAVRDIVRWHGTDVRDVLNARRGEFCPAVRPSQEQARLKAFWEWLAKGIGRPCEVVFRAGDPGSTIADFEREGRVLSLYADKLGKGFFSEPAGARQLGVLNHELAHWTPKADEHGAEFAHDNDDVGGALASFLFRAAEQARALLNVH